MRFRNLALFALVAASPAFAQSRLAEVVRTGFDYRNLGPYRAGSWITDLAIPDSPRSHLYTFYAAARNGGLWKTTNNGTTFVPVFENQSVSSVGAVAVAPSNDQIVWLGSGDNSATRSANRGDGVYKSVDAGRTWQHMGLRGTLQIARIVIHPTNPEIVYIAALGPLFSNSAERGLFKTVDGGKNWKKVLYVDEQTGAVDIVLNRNSPNTMYAATYQHQRRPWILLDGGPGSGVHKSVDGGETWKKLGGGFPTGHIGRIGLDISRKDPRILYAILEDFNPAPVQTAANAAGRAAAGGGGGGGAGGTGRAAGGGAGRATGAGAGRGPAVRNVGGGIYRSDDAGATWRKTSAETEDLSNKSGYAFNQIRVNPANPDQIFITGANLRGSNDAGRTWGRSFVRAFGDFRTFWIDPQNPQRMIAGSDGGVYISYDGGTTVDHRYNIPLGEVYALTVDMEEPYNIYAGLQDHESWKGPSNGVNASVGGIGDWSTVAVGDGMYNQVDPTDSRWVYNTQEFGRLGRFDQLRRVRETIAPTRPAGSGPPLRFNWVAPFRISPHNPKTLYAGAQLLFRSVDRGDNWTEISPDLTRNDPAKISPPGSSIQFCTITTISESPARQGVIWVGIDDGTVQVTRDGGNSWQNVTAAITAAGGLDDAWVTRVLGSAHDPAVAYVTKSRHRQDDPRPFVLRTADYGATWKMIVSGLPERSVHVIVEDPVNPNLLFVGNDIGVFTSVNAGATWMHVKGNMAVAPTHDMVIHPRQGDLVAGTYGRGIWITPITPLRELNDSVVAKDVHLFNIRPGGRRAESALGNYRLYGDSHLVTPNEPNGIVINYFVRTQSADGVSVTITDVSGANVRTLRGSSNAGMNRVTWDLLAQGRGGGGAGIQPGDYLVTLQLGAAMESRVARVVR